MLEEIVTSLGPGVALAKVNVDENQDLAMAFRVQSIPAVKIVSQGRLVDEFTGALPREQIEQVLRQHVPDAPPSEAEVTGDLLADARALLEQGDLHSAATIFAQVLDDDEESPGALVGMARIRLLEGDLEEVKALAARIERGTPEHDQAQALLTHLEFHQVCEQAGGRQACAEKLLSDPEDHQARYAFGCCAALQGEYEAALKEWFAVVEAGGGAQRTAAKEAMVSVFHLLGRHHPVVGDYPQRLYRTLY
jgi:putative thioredoxin